MPVRKRKEVQKMLRSLKPVARGQWPVASLVFCTAVANAAIFPDQIGEFNKGASKAVALADQALYEEYGVQGAEQAEYTLAQKRFTATAWRLRDSTGALALFEARRPANATPSKLARLAATTPDGAIFVYGNYLLQFSGTIPDSDALEAFYAQLPQLDQSPLPALISFLPQNGLVPNSERYILGPVSLERLDSRISPSLAALHLGAEAQSGRYQTANGELTLIVFNYPTPSIARDQEGAFLKLPGAIAKRSGPLVAVIVQPADADSAERLLSQVRYEANLTWNDKIPLNETKGMANLVLTGFAFAGVLGGLSMLVGIGFGGFRYLLRKLGKHEDPGGITVLRISDK
jgi:hypothetical protein